MRLIVVRMSSQADSTLGALFKLVDKVPKFLCFTLEDEHRTQKVFGETRIPAGVYPLAFRKEGGHHKRYLNKFGSAHKGMLHILDVPGFEYILIHIGNRDDDTAGCLLLGDTAQQNITEPGFIGHSTAAYERVYAEIARELEVGNEVKIQFFDFDQRKVG